MNLCTPCHRALDGWSNLGRAHFAATHGVCERCGMDALCAECDCSSERPVVVPITEAFAAPTIAFTADKQWHYADDLERLQQLRDHQQRLADWHQELAAKASRDASDLQTALDRLLEAAEAS